MKINKAAKSKKQKDFYILDLFMVLKQTSINSVT